MSIEYRIGWSASSNASFGGTTDWQPWDDDAADAEQVEDLAQVGGEIPMGLEDALNASGFEWWVEARERQDTAP